MTIERLVEILNDFRDFDPASVKPETTFEELGLDSLDVVDLVMKLEEETGVAIPVSENIRTIGNVLEFIKTNKA